MSTSFIRDAIRKACTSKQVCILAVATIWWLVVFLLANYAAVRLGTDRTGDIARTMAPRGLMPFFNFDAGWYWGIITEGYGSVLNARLAFYPLFPLLVQCLHTAVGLNVITAGYLINFVATLVSVSYIYRLSLELNGDDRVAHSAVVLFLFFPTAFFLSAFYSEALFCALTFSSFYYARRRNWIVSGILLGFLTATRLPGCIVAAAVVVEYASSIRFKVRELSVPFTALLVAPAGFICYGLFLSVQTHDFWNMFHAYSAGQWDYQRFSPNILATAYRELRLLASDVYHHATGWEASFANSLVPFLFWAAAVAATIYSYRRLPLSYCFFLAVSLIVFALNGNFVSVNRYVLPLFPLYLLAARELTPRPLALGIWIGISGMAFGIFLFLFANGLWIA